MTALPIKAFPPDEVRKCATIDSRGGGREYAEYLAGGLGDVRGVTVVLNCAFVLSVGDEFAEYLIARLLNAGAVAVEFAHCASEFWAVFSAAAEKLGVPDRVKSVPLTRLVPTRPATL